MAGGIKGITVEIGGDVTGLGKALKSVNKESKGLQDELKKVDRLLKLDPSNVDLLRQKQELLSEAVSASREKYDALKAAKEKAEKSHAANAEWERQYEPLNKALDEAKNKYGKLEDAKRKAEASFAEGKITADDLETVTKNCEEAKKGVDGCNQAVKDLDATFADSHISDEEYRDYNRQLAEAKNKTEDLERALKKCNPALESMAAKAKDAGDKFGKAAKAMTPVSAAAGGAVAGLGAMAVAAGKSADDINTLSKQTGLSTEQIQKFMYASDLIDVSFDTLSGSMAKMIKNMDSARKGTGDAEEAFKKLHVKIKDGSGALRDSETVFNETVKALGKVKNETDRDALAMKIFGRSAQDLNPLILGGADALEELGQQAKDAGLILSQDALDSANAFNDELDTLKATASGTFAEIGTTIATVLLPVLQEICDGLKSVMEWARGLDEGTLKLTGTVLLLVAGIAPLLGAIGQISMGVSGIIELFTSLGPLLSGIGGVFKVLWGVLSANPIVLVIAAIALLVGIFVTLWNNCEEFRQFWIDLWETLKAAPEQFAQWIAETLAKVIDAFNRLDDYLQNVFAVDWTESFGAFGEVLNALFASVSQIWDGIKEVFNGVITFIAGVFTGDWQKAWEGIKMIFKGVWDTLVGIVKMPINGIIGLINMAISGINALISGLNKIKISVPDWVPGLGGKQFGFNVPTIPKIPALAKGGELSEGMAIIAEAGPELLRMRGGKATVTPLSGGARAAAAGGVTEINEHYHIARGGIVVDPKSIKELEDFGEVLRRERSRRQDLQMGVVRGARDWGID